MSPSVVLPLTVKFPAWSILATWTKVPSVDPASPSACPLKIIDPLVPEPVPTPAFIIKSPPVWLSPSSGSIFDF